jgi:hypothetical protein
MTDTNSRVTVADFIAELLELPQDACLFVQGHDDGHHDAVIVEPAVMAIDASAGSGWWHGPHEQVFTSTDYPKSPKVDGYIIGCLR